MAICKQNYSVINIYVAKEKFQLAFKQVNALRTNIDCKSQYVTDAGYLRQILVKWKHWDSQVERCCASFIANGGSGISFTLPAMATPTFTSSFSTLTSRPFLWDVTTKKYFTKLEENVEHNECFICNKQCAMHNTDLSEEIARINE